MYFSLRRVAANDIVKSELLIEFTNSAQFDAHKLNKAIDILLEKISLTKKEIESTLNTIEKFLNHYPDIHFIDKKIQEPITRIFLKIFEQKTIKDETYLKICEEMTAESKSGHVWGQASLIDIAKINDNFIKYAVLRALEDTPEYEIFYPKTTKFIEEKLPGINLF